MKIYAIGDLHLDSKNEKPMNIFGDNWYDHENKIIQNWTNTVTDEDVVLIPGDISWAIKLEDALIDLNKIDSLPGNKIIGKGNHDYWWSTSKKMDKLGLKTIKFLKNNGYVFDDVIVCGTRGWEFSEELLESDNKILDREKNRLRTSLKAASNFNKNIITMLHYPPFNNVGLPNEFFQIMKEFRTDICIYGHIHGEEAHRNIKEGLIDNIKVHCVSSDYIDFKLKRIL